MSCGNKEAEQKIHRKMTIDEILSGYPGRAQMIAQELSNAGLHCASGCQAASYETLEAGVKSHGMSDDFVDELVDRLNEIVSKKVDLNTITITPKAAEKYLSILEEEKKQGWGLRLTEMPAGCNGFKSLLDYSEKATEDDEIFTSHGIEIHVKKGLVNRMRGTLIDFIDGLHESGFTISNPNAKSSCGCGSSYGY